jgi:hypothetical protein
VLRRAGYPALAQRLVIDTAAALQPDLHRGPDQLAVYGSLLAAAAYSAAAGGDRHSAHTLLDEATASAARLDGQRSVRVPVFSPAWVSVYRINTARVLGDYGTALDVARRLPAVTIPETEQRARYWATLARVFHEWGKPEPCYRPCSPQNKPVRTRSATAAAVSSETVGPELTQGPDSPK